MAIERLELPEDQWADIERRPTHGIMRKIARETQRAQRTSDPLEAEDKLVLNLVKAWNVTDDQGASLDFILKDFDRVPIDTWAAIVDVCTGILEDAAPNSPRGN